MTIGAPVFIGVLRCLNTDQSDRESSSFLIIGFALISFSLVVLLCAFFLLLSAEPPAFLAFGDAKERPEVKAEEPQVDPLKEQQKVALDDLLSKDWAKVKSASETLKGMGELAIPLS